MKSMISVATAENGITWGLIAILKTSLMTMMELASLEL